MKKCPSLICDKSKKKFTPEELCEHFKILGIPPFWKPGTVIKKESSNKLEDLTEKKVYTTDECLICMAAKPMIVFIPCHHHIVCMNCYKDLYKCPICRTNIKQKIPY